MKTNPVHSRAIAKSTKERRRRTHPVEDLADANPFRGLADAAIEVHIDVMQGNLLMVTGRGRLWALGHLCLLVVLHVSLVIGQRRVHRDGLLGSLHGESGAAAAAAAPLKAQILLL